MAWWLPVDRGRTSTGKTSGSGRYARLTRHLRDCHGRKDKNKKNKRQEIEIEPSCCSTSINDIGGHAKPDQHGRRHGGLGRGTAWASRRQTVLKHAALVVNWQRIWGHALSGSLI
jgi:hypothetical protein